MEREVGGGIRMGNTCKPMAVSFQYMTKSTTKKKKKKKLLLILFQCVNDAFQLCNLIKVIRSFIHMSKASLIAEQNKAKNKYHVSVTSILAWGIPWTEEPGGLQFMGSQRVQHDLAKNKQTIY